MKDINRNNRVGTLKCLQSNLTEYHFLVHKPMAIKLKTLGGVVGSVT